MSIHTLRASALIVASALALLVAALAPAEAQTPPAQGRAPLLMDGKRALYQKVLTRPEAKLAADPAAAATAKPVPPFSVYYVYGRRKAGDAEWVEVGASRTRAEGWIAAAETVAWKQTMTLAFTNPAGRDRVLFFRERDGLTQMLNSPGLLREADDLRRRILAGDAGPQSPVISIEPESFIDINSRFYLLPILDAQEVSLASGFPLTLVRVASITQEKPSELRPDAGAKPPPAAAQPPREFSAVVVFVIDTTKSMGPYIDRTRESIARIYRNVESAGLADRVRFGLVAFRSHLGPSPGLEYAARMYVDPKEVKDGKAFLERVRDLAEARVSSQGFDEEPYAGIALALDRVNWDDFDGRYIVLVTDAGAHEAGDPLSTTGLSTPDVRLLAERKGAAMFALHLLTPEGRNNHRKARDQYLALTRTAGGESLYFPVPAGDVRRFGEAVDGLAQTLISQVSADKGKQEAAVKAAEIAVAAARTEEEKRLREIELRAQQVGLAMRLAYLGRQTGAQAPSMFEAWAVDRDFRLPDRPSLEVRVLLTKAQLSDLQQVLRSVVDAGKAGQLAPQDFFNQLRSAAAAMGRDPTQVGRAKTIAELGLIGEYLDGLPYKSNIMSIDQDLWLSWGVGQQQQFIDRIESKIRLYRRFHDSDRWVRLNPAAPESEAVYPVPLEALP